MKTLTQDQQQYLKAFLKLDLYTGGLFYIGMDRLETAVSDRLSKRKGILQEIQTICELSSELQETKKCQVAIQSRFGILETDTSYFHNLQVLGFKSWLLENYICQIKRPDTLGNKGDYVGNDEKIDKFYENNKLFVRFSSKREYLQYEKLEDYDEYSEWFTKNEKKFTIIRKK